MDLRDFDDDSEEKLPFEPDWVSPPGDTILEVSHVDGTVELANSLCLSLEGVEALLCGKMRITPVLAARLAMWVGSNAQFWLNRDANYVRDCKRLGITPGEKKTVDHCVATAEPTTAQPPESKYETRVVSVVVLPRNEPLFSERATTISIVDAAGGEYVVVKQNGDRTDGAKAIMLNPDEWSTIRAAIDTMIGRCCEAS